VALCAGAAFAAGARLELGELARRTRPAVVHLEVRDGADVVVGTGTGFFIGTNGRLVTNSHVIEDAKRVVAKLDNGTQISIAGVLAIDEDADLALLRAEGSGFPGLELASEEPLQVGQEVIVIGSPIGLEGTLSTGIVSAIRRQGVDPGSEAERHSAWVLQITAPISAGSSGSPILARDGRVVGVAVGQVSSGQALNFGIPAEHLRALLARTGAQAVARPFEKPRGKHLWRNLSISAVVVGAIVFAFFLGPRLRGRREKPRSPWLPRL
jgi:serine protease Do